MLHHPHGVLQQHSPSRARVLILFVLGAFGLLYLVVLLRMSVGSAGGGGDGGPAEPQILPKPRVRPHREQLDLASPSSSSSFSSASLGGATPAAQVRLQNLLPHASSAGDSSGQMVFLSADPSATPRVDPFNYELCSYTNVCADSDGVRLFVQDEAEYNRLDELISRCFLASKSKAPEGMAGPCHCFYPTFKVALLPFWRREGASALNTTANPDWLATPAYRSQTSINPLRNLQRGHFFSVHHYVRIHHIAHWAQKIVLMQSAMQHASSLPGPSSAPLTSLSYDPLTLLRHEETFSSDSAPPYGPLQGMVFHDLELPLTAHESFILRTALRSMQDALDHPSLRKYTDDEDRDGETTITSDGTLTFAEELDAHAAKFAAWNTPESERLRQAQSQAAQLGRSFTAATEAEPDAPSLRCFERLTFTRAFGILSTSAQDTTAFRTRALATLDRTRDRDMRAAATAAAAAVAASNSSLSTPPPPVPAMPLLSRTLSARCPPRSAVLLYRENRGILNWDAIAAVVKEVTGRDLERRTINGESTPREQVELFASAGLLLSSHSSQLVNVMFSHPNSAMVEVTAEFYNADFSEYAHGMGVFFQYAIGGYVPQGVADPGHRDCNAVLSQCDGNSHCILRERYKCTRREQQNKQMDFVANITAVRQAVVHAYQHLNWACHGAW